MIKKFIVSIIIVVNLIVGYNLIKASSEPVPEAILTKSLKTHYLLDQEYISDQQNLFSTMGHLLVFNPGERDANLKLTLYYENDDLQIFSLVAPAKTSSESNYQSWPIKPKLNKAFALQVESLEPVICQTTLGWSNTNNDYSPNAATKSPKGARETAKSYMSITQLRKDWYIPDGIIIDQPNKLWIKESEWAVILNPGLQDAQVNLVIYYGKKTVQEKITVPAKRIKKIFMDDIVEHNRHYGARIISNYPIAAQWLRTVNWYDSPELMANWSVPAVPNP